jgi:hypothetical protein
MNVFDPDYSLMATDFPMEINGVIWTAEAYEKWQKERNERKTFKKSWRVEGENFVD